MIAASPPATRRRRDNPLLLRYRRAFRQPTGLAGATLIVALVVLAVLAPILFPGGYDEQGRDTLVGASLRHPFGTDELGRDLFVRTVYGVRADLSLVFVAVPIAAVVGTVFGMLSMVNRIVGTAAMRTMDVIVGFPGLILGISVTIVIGAGWTALVVALTVVSLPPFARLARSTLLTQQNREYVQAARMLGTQRRTIMLRHVVPHSLDAAVTQAVVAVVTCIFLESGLSLVGLGIKPPSPSLGSLLNQGARFMDDQSWYLLGPALALFLLVLGFSLVADALNRAGAGSRSS